MATTRIFGRVSSRSPRQAAGGRALGPGAVGRRQPGSLELGAGRKLSRSRSRLSSLRRGEAHSGIEGTRHSRRYVLKSLGLMATALLAACAAPPAAPSPTEAPKPAAGAPPRRRPGRGPDPGGRGGHRGCPADRGALAGTQPGRSKTRPSFKAPKVKASGPTTLTVLALRRLPRRRPEVHRRGVQAGGRPERLRSRSRRTRT